MLLDLKFSIGTLGIGSGAFVAALFGMNLKSFIEESDFGFIGVTGFSGVLAFVVCLYGLTKLRKVQRVSMWGEKGVGGVARGERSQGWGWGRKDAEVRGRGSWRETDDEAGKELVEGGRRERVRRLREERAGALSEGFEANGGGMLGEKGLPVPVEKSKS